MGNKEGSVHLGSDAFSLEYHRDISKACLHDDVASYLGEYRFAIPTYKYELGYVQDELGVFRLVTPHDHQPMTAICQRAIQKRKDAWKNPGREAAEYQCARKLEMQLAAASAGDMIFWTSPPGAPEDGYGRHGFFFVGEIAAAENSLDKRIFMTAFRIEDQSPAQCGCALTALVGEEVRFDTAEDCISHPRVVRPVHKETLASVLTDIFHFREDKRREQLFHDIIRIVKPQVNSFSDLIKKSGSRHDIKKGFWALENYVISLYDTARRHFDGRLPLLSSDAREAVIPFDMLVAHFGTPPPAVLGSCGASGLRRSSSLFNNSLSFLTERFSPESSENFVCPNCHKESAPPVGDRCPECKITKEEAKQKGFHTC